VKKLLTYLIVYLAVLVMQFGLAKYVSPYGVSPNLMLVCLIFIGLTRGPLEGELIGFAWGISWDAMSTDMFGSHAFLFTCLGYFSGLLSRKWDESKVSAQMSLALIASLFFMLGMKVVYGIFGANEYAYNFNYITSLQPFYNMLITPVVFWLGKGIIKILD
jgi:rod shape-determining protein MreD